MISLLKAYIAEISVAARNVSSRLLYTPVQSKLLKILTIVAATIAICHDGCSSSSVDWLLWSCCLTTWVADNAAQFNCESVVYTMLYMQFLIRCLRRWFWFWLRKQFLPFDALRCTVLVIVILSVCLSVCPSICHTRALCPHGSTYDHDFFTIW